MSNLKISYRNLFKKRENNAIKILSLGIGLAVGLVLLAKVTFELNYDDFYPGSDRIYQIQSNVIQDNKEKAYGQVSGAVAPGFKAEIPEVEAATRFTWLSSDANYRTTDKNLYKATFILADENFFDVLPLPVIAGDVKEILSGNLTAMVSKSVADRMGGDVIDKVIVMESYPGKEIVIRGIFRDLPKNSHTEYDIIVSLASIGHFMWDGRNNWLGNDRYCGYVKLHPDADYLSAATIRSMQEKYQPLEEIKKAGVDLTYSLTPITSIHKEAEGVKNTTVIMAIIAFALLITALLNYILIVITSIIERSRQVAIYKCYGASGWDMTKISLTDTSIHFILSLILALLLLLLFRGTVEELLGTPISALISVKSALLIAIVSLILFAIALFAATSLQSGISLIMLFKKQTKFKKQWKLALLFVQFAASAFLFALLIMINRQYDRMVNDDPGYSFKNVLYTNLSGVKWAEKQIIIDKFRQYPFVEAISLASELPINGMSGNNVIIPGDDRELFNIADMYYADENFIPLMEIKIVAGENFSEKSIYGDMLVSKQFQEKMQTLAGWESIVGREIIVTEHGMRRVVGVFEDIRLTSIIDPEYRPIVLSFAVNVPKLIDQGVDYIVVKLRSMSAQNTEILYNDIATLLPDREAVLAHYSDAMFDMYAPVRNIKNTIFIGGIITIIITLIGLIGYVNNEILRRRYEIAVRRVNGASIKDIVQPFVIEVLYISLPAIVLGVTATYIAIGKVLDNFSEKAEMPLLLYLACGIFILIIIEAVVVINSLKISNQKPVDSLKSE